MTMATFRCGAVPNGPVRVLPGGDEGLVWFVNGTAVVTDPAVALALVEVPDAFGISWDADEVEQLLDLDDNPPDDDPPPPVEVPPASASKADWVAYWVAHPDQEHRLDEVAANKLTRDKLVMRHAEISGNG